VTQPGQREALHTYGALPEAEEAWRRLELEGAALDVGSSYDTFAVWVRHLMSSAPLRLLAARGGAGDAVLMPLLEEPFRRLGLSLRLLRTPYDAHWRCAQPVVGDRGAEAVEGLLRQLGGSRDWDLLEAGPVLIDSGPGAALLDAGQRLGLRPWVNRVPVAYCDTSQTWDAFNASRSANLRANVGKAERRLAKQMGEVRLAEYRGGPDLEERLQRFYQLEASGWKGEAGSAIHCEPEVEAFYTDLARVSAERGWFRLYELFAGDECVGGAYCLAYRGTVFGWKQGIRDDLSRYSLGQILCRHLIQVLCEDPSTHTFDFVSGAEQHQGYKLRWATGTRDYAFLRLFNPKSPSALAVRAALSLQDGFGALRGRLRRALPSRKAPPKGSGESAE
jgi:CelD/BcsL family acetyltransferase involved in cellulose biosynthesis